MLTKKTPVSRGLVRAPCQNRTGDLFITGEQFISEHATSFSPRNHGGEAIATSFGFTQNHCNSLSKRAVSVRRTKTNRRRQSRCIEICMNSKNVIMFPAPAEVRWLSRTEAAEYLRMNPRTLANWATARTGPPFYRSGGRTVLYRLDELDSWVMERKAS